MNRDYTLYLQDILDCIEKIDEFVGDMDYEEFVEDDKTSSAVVRKLEIMGEAAKNIPYRMSSGRTTRRSRGATSRRCAIKSFIFTLGLTTKSCGR